MEPVLFLVAVALNALAAFMLSLTAAGRSFWRWWVGIAILSATAVVLALLTLGPQPQINYIHVALYAPWLVWIPLAALCGAWRRIFAGERPFPRWAYVMAVVFVSIAQGFATSAFHHPAVVIAASVGTVLLTYPMGMLGSALVVAPLIYLGIATPDEGYTFAAPFLAFLGYLQWYVLFPRAARRQAAQVAESSNMNTAANGAAGCCAEGNEAVQDRRPSSAVGL